MKIDQEAIAKAIGLPVKHIPILVATFTEEAMEILDALEGAVAEKNYEAVSRLAHSIKGSSGNLRLEGLYETAKAMEFAAKASDTSFDYPTHSKALRTLIEAIEL